MRRSRGGAWLKGRILAASRLGGRSRDGAGPPSGGLFVVAESLEKLLAQPAGDEDLLQIVEGRQRERDARCRERRSHRREGEVSGLLASRELRVLPVEDAAV